MMKKRNTILWVLIKKEMTQLRRNSFIPKLLVMLPVMLMLIMPLVTTMDVRNINIAVIDADQSSLSHRITSHLVNSTYFTYHAEYARYEDAIEALDAGKIDVVVSVPDGFELGLQRGDIHQIALVANGVNATKGSSGLQYAMQVIGSSLQERQFEQGAPQAAEAVVVENRYNPTANYRYFMIPALMIMLLILVCCFLPALNIVSEKENGTMEQLNVTPITPLQFTLAKLLPYWAIGLIELSVAMLLAWAIYGLTPVGNVGVIYIGAFCFLVTMSGLGVAIANISDTLQQTIFVMFFFVIIFILMSGLMTPIASMPLWAQNITYAFPPRYFIHIMRSVYLKGTTFVELLPSILALLGFATAFALIAMRTYKKQQ